MDLRGVYADPAADFLARYPSLLFGPCDEDFYRYFQYMLSVVVNSNSGLTTLKVEAFRAEDAQRIAEALLRQGEAMVNRLNARMEADAVKVAAEEVRAAEVARVAAEVALTEFRDRELLLDPDRNALMLGELIGKLAGDLAATETQLAELRGNAPNSPQLATLRQRAAALRQQIEAERGRISGPSEGLAGKIARYAQLSLEREFSVQRLAAAVRMLDAARLDARRQQLFLERVVEPNLPDEATVPERWRMVATVFGFNIIGMGVLWLLGSGLREHAAARRDQ
jgi:capsular polysaccharide transport system permease protein